MKITLIFFFAFIYTAAFSQEIDKHTWILYKGDTVYCSSIKCEQTNPFLTCLLEYTTVEGSIVRITEPDSCLNIPVYCLEGSYFDYVIVTKDTLHPKKFKDQYGERIEYGPMSVNLCLIRGQLFNYFKLPDGRYYMENLHNLNKKIIPVLSDCDAVKQKYGELNLSDALKKNFREIVDTFNDNCTY